MARSIVATPDALSSAPCELAPTTLAATGIDASTPSIVTGIQSDGGAPPASCATASAVAATHITIDAMIPSARTRIGTG